MKSYAVMKSLTISTLFFLLFSCNYQPSGKKLQQLNQDLSTVVDSISQLMNEYHYNPKELDTDEYVELEKKIKILAKTVKTRKEFINGFNELWKDGPFSHVRLTNTEKLSKDMAEFIDTMQVGEHSVSLNWEGQTAILTVTTMTGLDTKERVFEAYQEITKNKANSLIIDLRNNTGGTFAGVPLVGHVLSDSIDAGIFVSRKWWKNNTETPVMADIQNLEPWQGWSIKSFWRDVQDAPLTRVKFIPMNPHFNGSVYVLISHKTASAAEFTVDAIAQEESVTIIGETTAGEMLSQKMYDIPHGFQVSLPIAEYYSHRIGKIEGQGVEPDIEINQSVALDIALSLIEGEKLEDVMSRAEHVLNEMKKQPLGDKAIYLLGSMNEWGKKMDATPQFKYKGKGIYETTTSLKKGRYEFKIAPLNWDFDFGANSKQEQVVIGKKVSLAKVARSSNLIIAINEETTLTFSLYVSDEKIGTLQILKN
ncbi:S41 family peptidase [Eudoraea sp.]|uniref:S41 family peptidase n=1 Tax=Eudoraea sp. TaxID=1979955 RepID=UPI003C75E3AD